MNQNYYDEKIKTLPENLQYAVIMSDWKKSLIEIQNQFKLHIDQTQILEECVMRLMFGDIDAPDFISEMFNNAHVNSETAADILLEVDLKILKKIRQRLEAMEEKDKEDEELEYILLDDDEKKEKDEEELFANFYEEAEKIKQETEAEMVKEGISPDGSNITDEMLGIKTEIPNDIDQEKIDLLKEIEMPSKATETKSVEIKELVPGKIDFTENKTQEEIISPDHQIQNTEIEKPYYEKNIIPETKTGTKSEPKKPITIKLDDIYREPIE